MNSELQHFAHAVSHDLREPLRTIDVYAEMLKKDQGASLTAKGSEYLQFSESARRMMIHFIEALLQYSPAGDSAGKSRSDG